MEFTVKRLLETEQFKSHINSLDNPSDFLTELYSAIKGPKIRLLLKAFPEGSSFDQVVSSLLLNLQQNYDSIITDLPPQFYAARKGMIHVGNTNQIGIHYNGEIKKEKVDLRVGCISFHFRDVDNTQFMYLDNLQGELHEENHSHKISRRVYGKLNSHFEEDWRIGLARQTIQYAHDRGIKVRGEIPGIFSLFGDSSLEYPIYSLNYVKTYLRSGIPLENIKFKSLPDNVPQKWSNAMDFLKTKSLDEILPLLDVAYGEYTKLYNKYRSLCLKDKIPVKLYMDGCKMEFERIFDKYLS